MRLPLLRWVVSIVAREARIAPFFFLIVLVGSGILSSAATPATLAPESLRTIAPVLEVRLKKWLVEWRAVQPGLRIEQFKKVLTRDIGRPWESITSVTMDTLLRDPMSALYVLSPDGHWIVDPFGGLFLTKEDSHFVVSGEPDTHVLLIDRKMSKVRDISDCGTSCGFHEAAWLSHDIFVVAGYGDGEPKPGCAGGYMHAPGLYLFNPGHNSLTWYLGPSSCGGVGYEYVIRKIQEKIPNVKS
jgi:hypothetical protein